MGCEIEMVHLERKAGHQMRGMVHQMSEAGHQVMH